MNNHHFFLKPTALYNEYLILDLISKNNRITQREISSQIKVAVSTVNLYLDNYEKQGHIKRKYFSTKTVKYIITKKGQKRYKLLGISYLQHSQVFYTQAKQNLVVFLDSFAKKGFKNILFYGAGEVAETMLQVLEDNSVNLKVQAIIDDDATKQGKQLRNIDIISLDEMNNYNIDGILVASFTQFQSMLESLNKINYDKTKILNYFDF